MRDAQTERARNIEVLFLAMGQLGHLHGPSQTPFSRKLQSSRERRWGLFPMVEKLFCYPFVPPNPWQTPGQLSSAPGILSYFPWAELIAHFSLLTQHFMPYFFYHWPYCIILFLYTAPSLTRLCPLLFLGLYSFDIMSRGFSTMSTIQKAVSKYLLV